jgi:broad specificity phosphatase PhoE
VKTARIISEQFCVDIQTADDFAERNMGVFEGLTGDEIADRYPEYDGWMMTRQFYALHPMQNHYWISVSTRTGSR